MKVEIKEVLDGRMLKAFIDFPYQLYKNHPCYIPPLRFDEEATLRRDKNPAFDHCEARYWLAYRSGKVVGRIAGILNKAYIEKWGQRHLRFGWLDFEDDEHIAAALAQQVEKWGKELGMEAVHGPLGFTDLDPEGMLIEGFDQRGTLASFYNYAYYPPLLERAGYQKHADWVEYKLSLPGTVDSRLVKLSDTVQKRLGLQLVPLKKTKDLMPFVPAIFSLINSAYENLYSVVPLTEKQIRYYTKQYFSFMRPDFVSLIIDHTGELAAFGITMPSLSAAFQKAKGRLFPLGFYHLLKALRKNDTADLLLVAVRKDLQKKGVNALVMRHMLEAYIRNGIRFAEASHQLEDNKDVQAMWNLFDATQHKRRRCYIKYLNSYIKYLNKNSVT